MCTVEKKKCPKTLGPQGFEISEFQALQGWSISCCPLLPYRVSRAGTGC